MRIMLMGLATYLPELVGVADKLKADGHQIVFWERSNKDFDVDKSRFPGTIFRNHVYVGQESVEDYKKIAEFEPLGEDIVSKFFDTEVIVLPMMERYYKEKTTQEKRQIYYDLFRYWYGMIKKITPDVAIFEGVAHHPDTCIAYAVLKYFGVKTIIINFTNIKDRLILTLDNKFNSLELQSRLKNNLGKDFNLKDLFSEMRINLEIGTRLKEDPVQSTKRCNECKNKNLYNFSGLKAAKIIFWLKVFVSFRIWEIAYKFVKNRISGNAKKEYLKIQKIPDFNSKYIYVPLHVQPEASTNIFGGIFANQINFIEILSASLPEGWKIYVKEHPVQFYSSGIGYNTYRYEGYYQRMVLIKGVEIVPLNTDTYKLIERSQAVATVTGTAAWEAAVRLKPALIFGHIWFQDCPGVFKVNNVAKCRDFFDLVKNGKLELKKEKLVNYMFSLQEATVCGNIYLLSKSESSIDENTNVSNLYRSIAKVLK